MVQKYISFKLNKRLLLEDTLKPVEKNLLFRPYRTSQITLLNIVNNI
jgi:hypothetical protein